MEFSMKNLSLSFMMIFVEFWYLHNLFKRVNSLNFVNSIKFT